MVDNDHCHLCGKKFIEDLPATRDHIVPVSRGGLDQRFNVVWTCAPCNNKKSDDWPWCPCSICKKSRRIHWELYRISEFNRGTGWKKPEKKKFIFN